MQPFANFNENMYLGSPAVTNAAPTDTTDTTGLGWLAKFIEQCDGCSIDFINIHWYDSAKNIDYFKQYIEDARRLGGNRPIWVTQLRASGTDEEVIKFLDEVMPWMDNSSDIHRYAYIMARPGEGMLINEKGDGLSDIGKKYDFFDH
jgi:hypothetical protein